MDSIMPLWQQLNSLCLYIQYKTKLKISTIFEINKYHLDIKNNNDESIFSYTIDGIFVKSNKVIIFELKQLINYLIELKQEKVLC